MALYNYLPTCPSGIRCLHMHLLCLEDLPERLSNDFFVCLETIASRESTFKPFRIYPITQTCLIFQLVNHIFKNSFLMIRSWIYRVSVFLLQPPPIQKITGILKIFPTGCFCLPNLFALKFLNLNSIRKNVFKFETRINSFMKTTFQHTNNILMRKKIDLLTLIIITLNQII